MNNPLANLFNSNKEVNNNNDLYKTGKNNEPFGLEQLTYTAQGILFWKTVPRNCKLIVEDLIGKRAVRIKNTGIRFVWMGLQKSTIIRLSSFSITYSIKDHDGTVTKDGIDVHGTTRINYEIDTKNIKRYYDQEFANEQLRNESIAVIKEFISKYKWEEIKKKKSREITAESEIYEAALKLAKEYGIRILSIDTTGMQAPPEIAELEERKRAAENEYQIKIAQAKAELDVKKLQNAAKEAEGITDAKIEDLKGTIRMKNANKLIDMLFAQNFDTQQALEFLKRTVTNQNSVIVEGNGSTIDSQTILLAMSKLQNMEQNQQTNDFGNSSLGHR